MCSGRFLKYLPAVDSIAGKYNPLSIDPGKVFINLFKIKNFRYRANVTSYLVEFSTPVDT
jgi:hypothetical protein